MHTQDNSLNLIMRGSGTKTYALIEAKLYQKQWNSSSGLLTICSCTVAVMWNFLVTVAPITSHCCCLVMLTGFEKWTREAELNSLPSTNNHSTLFTYILFFSGYSLPY